MGLVRQVLATLFILFHFLVFIRIFIPLQAPFFAQVYRPVDAYLSFFSIYQDWMMFAPDPSKLNTYLTAEVEYEDATKDTYTFPRSEKLSLFGKYTHGEKFRKVITDGIRKNENQFLWKDTAKFAIRKLKDKNGYKIPLRVNLFRHWDEIENINIKFRSIKEEPESYQSFNFYTYEVGQ